MQNGRCCSAWAWTAQLMGCCSERSGPRMAAEARNADASIVLRSEASWEMRRHRQLGLREGLCLQGVPLSNDPVFMCMRRGACKQMWSSQLTSTWPYRTRRCVEELVATQAELVYSCTCGTPERETLRCQRAVGLWVDRRLVTPSFSVAGSFSGPLHVYAAGVGELVMQDDWDQERLGAV